MNSQDNVYDQGSCEEQVATIVDKIAEQPMPHIPRGEGYRERLKEAVRRAIRFRIALDPEKPAEMLGNIVDENERQVNIHSFQDDGWDIQ